MSDMKSDEMGICSRCEYIVTYDDFINNNWGKIDGKIFHSVCYYKFIETNNLYVCNECYRMSNKNDVDYITRTTTNGDTFYYHKTCVPNSICSICDEDLELEECIDIAIDWHIIKQFHKKCVENIYDLCDECNKSLRVKCLGCNKRFNYCYNNCDTSINDEHCYDGYCQSCDW